MRSFLFFSVGLFVFAMSNGSCSHATKNGLSGSDSLVINFNTPGSNNIQKTVSTTSRNAIAEISGYVDEKPATVNNSCMFDGNLIFYKKSELVADVSFNFSEDSCRVFIKQVNGKLEPTVMTNKAADMLKDILKSD
jgi:hypothetical protein